QPLLPPSPATQIRSRRDGEVLVHERSTECIGRDRNAKRRFDNRIDGWVLYGRTQRQMRLVDVEHRKLYALLDMADADRAAIGGERRDHIREGGEPLAVAVGNRNIFVHDVQNEIAPGAPD